jgi:aspartyl/glutamyl-tRNA(Asn/Gln) amidotransferase C subunit
MQPKDIEALADLARITITPEEIPLFTHDIEVVLDYVSQIADAGVVQTVLADHRNITRDDVSTTPAGTYTDALLAQTNTQDQMVVVPKIL